MAFSLNPREVGWYFGGGLAEGLRDGCTGEGTEELPAGSAGGPPESHWNGSLRHRHVRTPRTLLIGPQAVRRLTANGVRSVHLCCILTCGLQGPSNPGVPGWRGVSWLVVALLGKRLCASEGESTDSAMAPVLASIQARDPSPGPILEK